MTDSAVTNLHFSPLGNDSGISSQNGSSSGRRKYVLQNQAARLLSHRRVARCHRTLLPGAGLVEVVRSQRAGHAWYQGLFVCADPWCCPACASRIGAERTDELKRALVAASNLAWTPALLTLTLRHTNDDPVVDVRRALNGAVTKFKQDGSFRRLKLKYGWVGDIRNLETTYGAHGWHPHCHFLVFFDRQLTTAELSDLEQELYQIWERKLESFGFDASYEHGIDFKTADGDIAAYVAKFGRQPAGHWGAGEELGRSTAKRGHLHGLTPFELLESSTFRRRDPFWKGKGRHVGNADRAGELFQEYAAAFKGAHQLQWSKGLRDMLDVRTADDQAVAEQDDVYGDAEQVITLDQVSWRTIVNSELRAELLDEAKHGNGPRLFAWLRMNGVYLIDLRQFDMGPRSPAAARPRASPPAAHASAGQPSIFDPESQGG